MARQPASRPPEFQTIDEEAGEVYHALPDSDSDEAYREVDVLAAESVSAFGCRSDAHSHIRCGVPGKKTCCRRRTRPCTPASACLVFLFVAVAVTLALSVHHGRGGSVSITVTLPSIVDQWFSTVFVVPAGMGGHS